MKGSVSSPFPKEVLITRTIHRNIAFDNVRGTRHTSGRSIGWTVLSMDTLTDASNSSSRRQSGRS